MKTQKQQSAADIYKLKSTRLLTGNFLSFTQDQKTSACFQQYCSCKKINKSFPDPKLSPKEASSGVIGTFETPWTLIGGTHIHLQLISINFILSLDYLGGKKSHRRKKFYSNFTNLMKLKEDYEHLKAVLRCDETTRIT